MKTAIILVSGNIQKVGYRAKVTEIANESGIKGDVENLKDGSVRIIAQSEDENKIKEFATQINIKNTLIKVDNVSVDHFATGKIYTDFKKVVKPKETDERLDCAVGELKKLIVVTKGGFDDLSGKQSQMLDKQDQMTGKLDLIHNDLSVNLKSFHQDTINRFDIVDQKYGMIAQNMEKIFIEMKEERIETRKTMKELIGAVLKVAEKR